MRSLKERWYDYVAMDIRKWKMEYPPEQFVQLVDGTINDVLEVLSSDLQGQDFQHRSKQEIKELLDSKGINSDRIGGLKKIKGRYNSLWNLHVGFIELRRQEDWANTWDQLKTLTYRTFYGIVIATIVLGTGYVSGELDIPLPLLRLP